MNSLTKDKKNCRMRTVAEFIFLTDHGTVDRRPLLLHNVTQPRFWHFNLGNKICIKVFFVHLLSPFIPRYKKARKGHSIHFPFGSSYCFAWKACRAQKIFLRNGGVILFKFKFNLALISIHTLTCWGYLEMPKNALLRPLPYCCCWQWKMEIERRINFAFP